MNEAALAEKRAAHELKLEQIDRQMFARYAREEEEMYDLINKQH